MHAQVYISDQSDQISGIILFPSLQANSAKLSILEGKVKEILFIQYRCEIMHSVVQHISAHKEEYLTFSTVSVVPPCNRQNISRIFKGVPST